MISSCKKKNILTYLNPTKLLLFWTNIKKYPCTNERSAVNSRLNEKIDYATLETINDILSIQ